MQAFSTLARISHVAFPFSFSYTLESPLPFKSPPSKPPPHPLANKQTAPLHPSIPLAHPQTSATSSQKHGARGFAEKPNRGPPPRAPLTSHSHPISKIRNPRRRRNRLRLLGCGLWVRRRGGLDEEGDRGSVEVSGKKARWMERAVERGEGEEGEEGGGGLGGWRRGLGGWGGGWGGWGRGGGWPGFGGEKGGGMVCVW